MTKNKYGVLLLKLFFDSLIIMYDKINIVPHLIKEAEKFIIENDRMLYSDFLKITELYCEENSILIGGKVGIDLLISQPITKESFFYELYTDDTYNHAKKLTDRLYSDSHTPHIDKKYIVLRTDIRNREFTININTRSVIKIYNLDKYRNIRLIKLMGPPSRKGYFSDKFIKCISEEIQLIEIYRTLYSPIKVAQWNDYLRYEKELYLAIKSNVARKVTEKIEELNLDLEFLGALDNSAKNKWKSHIENTIIDKIVRKSNNVLIGDYAINCSLDISSKNTNVRLQLISEESIDNFVKQIERALKDEKISGTVSYIRYNLNILTDFQILKYTIYVTSDKNQIPILDFFNSSSFELIPFAKGKDTFTDIKLGNLFVLLRFKFIDLWVMRLILNIGTDNINFLRDKIKDMLDQINKLRTCISKKQKEELFQLKNYVGVYINETVAKKKLIIERGEKFAPYYPAKNKITVAE